MQHDSGSGVSPAEREIKNRLRAAVHREMAALNQQGPLYSPPQGYGAPYRYDEALVDPQIPKTYPESFDAAPPPPTLPQHPLTSSQTQPPSGQVRVSSGNSEPKQRLRKACDSCSVRKVKCDESGPPCKSCAALEIPCTFSRPSRRRGPPNRHAEAIKKQKLEEGGALTTSSPTHDAAWGLAALSLPATLSAESICDINILEVLIDDYFLYIHPLIPVPHEPSFRAAFARREDKTDRTFLCLVATMMEALVASFPRRVITLFSSEQMKHQYPNAGALIDHIHRIFLEARGTGHLDRQYSMNETTASYLAGIAAAYIFDIRRMRMYFSECVMMLRGMGFHRPDHHHQNDDEAPRPPVDQVYKQSGLRLFWLMFVGAMSGRQLDEPEGDILMPPIAFVEMLPPLPAEVDDQYITHDRIYPQPNGVVSEIVGFNLNCKVYRAFHLLAAIETAFGVDTVYDWDRQKQVIRRALQAVKAAVADAPQELQLNFSTEFGEWPPVSYDTSMYAVPQGLNGQYPYPDVRRGSLSLPFPKRAVQYEIQKANIYGSLLATRSYLVERYWNLYVINERERPNPAPRRDRVSSMASNSSPTSTTMDHRFIASMAQNQTPSDTAMDPNEQTMAVERENIVRDLAVLLKSINQVNMEPNGLSFCNKIRQIASTLVDTNHGAQMSMPTLDSTRVNDYLNSFLGILSKLSRLGAGRIRPDEENEYDNPELALEAIAQAELSSWASLKERQEEFIRSEQIMLV